MAGYIGNIPVPQALRNYDVFTATSGQTVFNVKSYDPSFIDVYQNGVKLVDGDDYTATDGNTVVLASGATLNDIVEVISFTTFYPADVVSASTGGTFFGAVSFDADVTPDSDATYDLGSSSKAWAEVHADKVLTDTFEDRSASKSIDAVYVTDGTAKAWINFNGTGTIAARDSLNVSSLTDNGTGDYTVNLTNAMSDSDFVVTTNSKQAVSATVGAGNAVLDSSAGVLATTSARVFSVYGATKYDAALFFTNVHGDLA